MDETFHKLLQRGTYKKDKTTGDPWEFIPIKNRKQAKNCIELHMANKSFQQLKGEEFEHFPNLEVLYLNDNQFEQIQGLDANFRIKNLYLFNNKLKTLDGSLEYLTHLEILLLYNNELRDLDKQIEFLKRYPNLKQLDLFQNPICEEPNYRAKIIYNLPSLKILDRHVITYTERIKAEKQVQEINIVQKKKEVKKRIQPSQMFSQGEIDCYREAASLKQRYQKEKEDQIKLEETIKQEKIQRKKEKEQNKVPRSQYQIQLEQRRKEDPNHIITEYEKDKINFIYEKNKHFVDNKLMLKKEDISKIYYDLQNDEGLIGIVPTCTEQQFQEIINPDNLEIIEYDDYRLRLNNMYWDKPSIQQTQERIKQLYYKGNQKLNRGNKQEAYVDFNNAIRLQTKLDMDEHSQPVFETMKQSENGTKRFDSFDFGCTDEFTSEQNADGDDIYDTTTCKCIDGYFFNLEAEGYCQECNSKCETCEYLADNCLTCAYGDITNFCSCGDGEYYSTTSSACENCSDFDDNCAQCNENDKCIKCSGNLILNSGQCECQDGYALQTDGSCLITKNGCQTYDSSGDCTKCFNGYSLASGVCSPCASGQYSDGITCTCSDYSYYDDTCTDCIDGYESNEWICVRTDTDIYYTLGQADPDATTVAFNTDTDIGTCKCDFVSNYCEQYCCCDGDCSADIQDEWNSLGLCSESESNIQQKCVSNVSIYRINEYRGMKKIEQADLNQICVQFDNTIEYTDYQNEYEHNQSLPDILASELYTEVLSEIQPSTSSSTNNIYTYYRNVAGNCEKINQVQGGLNNALVTCTYTYSSCDELEYANFNLDFSDSDIEIINGGDYIQGAIYYFSYDQIEDKITREKAQIWTTSSCTAPTTSLTSDLFFQVAFIDTDNNPNKVQQGGLPGYVSGLPVQYLLNNDGSYYQETNGLFLTGSASDGVCTTGTIDFQTNIFNPLIDKQLLFNQELKYQCNYDLSGKTVQNDCANIDLSDALILQNFIRKDITNQYIGQFGNANPRYSEDWISIINSSIDTTPTYSSSAKTCTIQNQFVLVIFYKNFGFETNLQRAVIQAQFFQKDKKTSYTELPDSLNLSIEVKYINVDYDEIENEMPGSPTSMPQFPKDIFYPIWYDGSSVLSFNLILLVLCYFIFNY
ncbi:Insulin-like growth factor binding protein, N-terminal [Pseudocohnilembus persalinus]|uniref:Insulin-like growth factor binding protein, N-terminal n=1 Tax=Pseudocohnilembus persalinus TaxID=266149 RepID=A0A0V0QRI8_PSEPJ|nr:Insulin-like growth factor binding protein, N-terminal [Pseudocohnilembus persalinus]|eukprot:KRX04889.1 Insulin-like growth factor binding protein, N-terminal [Pseudocohnilembus persalinus]